MADPLPLTDLSDLDAIRQYFEVKPIQDFIEYLNWGNAASTAIGAGATPPPAPVRLPNVETVLAQIQKIDNFVVTLGNGAVVSPPDPNAVRPAADLQGKVKTEISRQTAYVYSLQSRAELVTTLQDKLSQVEQASYNIKDNLLAIMDWFSDNRVPLPGGLVLDDALLDLDLTIPNAVSRAIDDAKTQSTKYQNAITNAKNTYAAWDAMAQNLANGWDYNAYKQAQQQSIDDAGGDAKGAAAGAGGGGGGGGQTITTTVSGGAAMFQVSNIAGVPASVVVDVYTLRPDWDPYPPLEPPTTIPPGGSLTALTMFPSDETTLDLYAVQADGTWSLLQSFRGGNGEAGEPLTWKNELAVPVVIQSLAWTPGPVADVRTAKRKSPAHYLDLPALPTYSGYNDPNPQYLNESTRFSFNQLSVTSWGYLPEGVDPPPFGAPNSAILLIAKTDLLSTDARPSLLPITHSVTLGQLNVLAQVQFLGPSMNISFPGVDGDADFWAPLHGAIDDNFADSIVLAGETSFVFAGQVDNPGGAPLPTFWNGQRFNPELFVVGVGNGNNANPLDAVVLISFQRAAT